MTQTFTTVNARGNKNNKLAAISGRLIPSHFKDMESEIVPFIRAYYKWLDDNGVDSQIYQLLDYQNVDLTPTEFLTFFKQEFIRNLPQGMAVDQRFIIKYIRGFYRSRGTEAALKFLFKILYNDDITITYPKDKILRASDGIWRVGTYIRVSSNDSVRTLKGRQIFGQDSSANAIVESVVETSVGGYLVAQLQLSNVQGTFVPDEIIETRGAVSTEAPLVNARVYGLVNSYNLTNPGTGYNVNELLPVINNGDGTGFIVSVNTVGGNGEITSLRIDNPGYFYFDTPPIVDPGAASIPSRSNPGVVDAVVTFNIGARVSDGGSFYTTRGFLNSDMVLQDGNLYQEYSYIINTSVPASKFVDIVRRNAHPAGVRLSGQLVSVTNPDDIDNLPILYHLSGGVVSGPNYKDPRYKSSRHFWEPEIEITPWKIRIIDLINTQGPVITADTMTHYVHEWDTDLHVRHCETYLTLET